jgi:hypothetical protein
VQDARTPTVSSTTHSHSYNSQSLLPLTVTPTTHSHSYNSQSLLKLTVTRNRASHLTPQLHNYTNSSSASQATQYGRDRSQKRYRAGGLAARRLSIPPPLSSSKSETSSSKARYFLLALTSQRQIRCTSKNTIAGPSRPYRTNGLWRSTSSMKRTFKQRKGASCDFSAI